MRKICHLFLLTVSPIAFAQTGVSVPGVGQTSAPRLYVSPMLASPALNNDEIVTFTDSARADITNNTNTITLDGKSQIRRPDAILKADTINYDRSSGTVTALGNARLFRDGNLITGPGLRYNIDKVNGTITSPVYSLATGGQGQASQANIIDDNHVNLTDATYSGCNCEEPFWQIRSSNVDLYNDENEGIAEDGTLYIKGVPVMWSPYLTFPIRAEKKTGFLTPTYGMTSRSGLDLSVPYFINLAPQYDLTLVPRYLSKRGAQLGAEFRYLQPNYSGTLTGTYMHRDNELDRSRWMFSWRHLQSLGSVLGLNFNLSVDWNAVSDDDYYRDFTDMTTITQADKTYLNRNVTLGFSGYKYWDGYLQIQKYQTLQDATTTDIYGQYEKVPELRVHGARFDWHGLDMETTNTLTRFEYPTYFGSKLSDEVIDQTEGHLRPDGTRFTSYSTLSYPIVRPGWYITPKIGVHASQYETDWYTRYGQHSFYSQSGNQRRSVSRVLPIVSLDAGMTFERDTTLFGYPSTQTLEPRLYYLYIPYQDQSDIPIFDTDVSQFGFASAFSENRYNGGWDRINNANQVTLGLTSRWFDRDTGFQRLALQVAQRVYFDSQRVTLPFESPRTGTKSDWIFGAEAALTNKFTTQAALQIDPYQGKTTQVYAAAKWTPKRLTTLSLSYRYQRDPYADEERTDINQGNPLSYQLQGKETVSFAGQWPFTSKLYGVGRVDYSLKESRVTQHILGVEYKGDCCWTGRVVLKRYAVSKQDSNSAIFFQLELAGLGSVGKDPMDLLRQNVPGYESVNTPVPARTSFERYE